MILRVLLLLLIQIGGYRCTGMLLLGTPRGNEECGTINTTVILLVMLCLPDAEGENLPVEAQGKLHARMRVADVTRHDLERGKYSQWLIPKLGCKWRMQLMHSS